jgi:hypothetical protein
MPWYDLLTTNRQVFDMILAMISHLSIIRCYYRLYALENITMVLPLTCHLIGSKALWIFRVLIATRAMVEMFLEVLRSWK